MRSKWWLCCWAWLALAGQYEVALPGYRYEFPRDHFSHPGYATEWWYYTGNLRATDGHEYGFELTFFRQAIDAGRQTTGTWRADQLYLAHLALSDLTGQKFYHDERLNRPGPGLAGVDAGQGRYWNGNWQVQRRGERHELTAVADQFAMRLSLEAVKPLVIHGEKGVSQKAPGVGRASHYISYPRLAVQGEVTVGGKAVGVTGLAWMDHEFFTHQLDETQAGWDWFSVQLENNEELMLYRLRKKDGTGDSFSSGTFVDAAGQSRFLRSQEFELVPGEGIRQESGAAYPLRWQLRVPSLGLTLEVSTALARQELVSQRRIGPNYWEGAVRYRGERTGKAVQGVGYLEMTGYDRSVQLGDSQ